MNCKGTLPGINTSQPRPIIMLHTLTVWSSRIVLVSLTCTFCRAAKAQTNVDSVNKNSWSENCGWMNWRDSGDPSGSQGALIAGSFMSGMIWHENTGYINLGDGTPVDGVAYANSSGTDAGVNILGDNRLGGLAWGENIGWINFGPHATLPGAQQARLDPSAGRLRGFTWGENIGWINLDHSTHFVGIECTADFNQDGFVDFFDYLDFVDAFSSELAAADFNQDNQIDFFDYLDFVDAFSIGC